MTPASRFAADYGKRLIWELSRYLRAGCSAQDLGELVGDLVVVIEVTGSTALRGGRA